MNAQNADASRAGFKGSEEGDRAASKGKAATVLPDCKFFRTLPAPPPFFFVCPRSPVNRDVSNHVSHDSTLSKPFFWWYEAPEVDSRWIPGGPDYELLSRVDELLRSRGLLPHRTYTPFQHGISSVPKNISYNPWTTRESGTKKNWYIWVFQLPPDAFNLCSFSTGAEKENSGGMAADLTSTREETSHSYTSTSGASTSHSEPKAENLFHHEWELVPYSPVPHCQSFPPIILVPYFPDTQLRCAEQIWRKTIHLVQNIQNSFRDGFKSYCQTKSWTYLSYSQNPRKPWTP